MLWRIKLLANPFDKMAFEESLPLQKRGIGPKSVFEIAKISSEDQVDYATALLRWSTLGRGKSSSCGSCTGRINRRAAKQHLGWCIDAVSP